MLLIDNENTYPYFNMAVEEYLLRSFDQEIFMLWRNSAAVIVGKHQNTFAEIEADYVKNNNITVVRRLTGGGAVFHDLGNINFTFISNSKEGNFRTFTQPIIDFLQELGVNAQFEGRNDLTINGRKFSGNAMLTDRNRILQHGTLLFSAQMTDLTKALNPSKLKFKDKSVQSVKSRVTNISEHLNNKMDVNEFRTKLMQFVAKHHPDSVHYNFNGIDILNIEQLAQNKYAQWDWNFGNSPNYTFQNEIKTKGGSVQLHLDAVKGCIKELKIYGDFFGNLPIESLEELLLACPLQDHELKKRLDTVELDQYMLHVDQASLVNALLALKN